MESIHSSRFSMSKSSQHRGTWEVSRMVLGIHDSLFFEEKVICTDEKYFVLNQGPNKSINKIWAPTNPYVDVQCKTQSQQRECVGLAFVQERLLDHSG